MEEEVTREEAKMEPTADGQDSEAAEGNTPIFEGEGQGEDLSEEPVLEEELPRAEEMGEDNSKALERSIGLGLPSDRYRVVLPKGSFPPLTGRQQFIARLRDRDKVSFRVFEGDEDLASQNEFLAEIGMAGVALNNEDKAFLEVDFHLNLDKILTVRLMDKFGEKEALIILDLARRPKTDLQQNKVAELMEKLDSLGDSIKEVGDKLDTLGGDSSKKAKG